MPAYQDILEENKIFLITNFFVNESKKFYNVIQNTFTINFVRTIKVVKSTKDPDFFASYHYNFITIEELENIVRKNGILSDQLFFKTTLTFTWLWCKKYIHLLLCYRCHWTIGWHWKSGIHLYWWELSRDYKKKSANMHIGVNYYHINFQHENIQTRISL